jgi:hypothetical protein
VGNKVKMAILEKYAKAYYIVSDEDVLIMYKKAAELQKTCDAETCLRQIAEAIDADEVLRKSLYQGWAHKPQSKQSPERQEDSEDGKQIRCG